MRIRRAALYMPGDSMRKIQKAAGMSVDTIIMDLEDGVAFNRKEAARKTILDALQTLDFGENERLVRVNGVGTGLTAFDILESIAGQPDGYVLPKVETAEQVHYVSHLLYDLEAHHGFQSGHISLQAIIETSRGVVNAREIARASLRLTALQFGAEDLAGDMGLTRSKEGTEVFYARSVVVTEASAAGLQAIDGVYLDFNDVEGAYKEARRMAQMGYQGKMAIHPNQIEPYHRAFTPSDEEIAAARRIVEAAAAQEAQGVGAFVLDGKMIDRAIVRPAEQVLARARAAGKR